MKIWVLLLLFKPGAQNKKKLKNMAKISIY